METEVTGEERGIPGSQHPWWWWSVWQYLSLKGIFSGRDLLSFHCKKLFIAAWLLKEAQTRHSPWTSWGGSRCIFQKRSLHPPFASPSAPCTFLSNWKIKTHEGFTSPNSRTGSSPYPETQPRARSAGRGPGRLRGRRRISCPSPWRRWRRGKGLPFPQPCRQSTGCSRPRRRWTCPPRCRRSELRAPFRSPCPRGCN